MEYNNSSIKCTILRKYISDRVLLTTTKCKVTQWEGRYRYIHVHDVRYEKLCKIINARGKKSCVLCDWASQIFPPRKTLRYIATDFAVVGGVSLNASGMDIFVGPHGKGVSKTAGEAWGACLASVDAYKSGGKKTSTASVKRGPEGKGISNNPEPATQPLNASLKPTSQYDSTPAARPPKTPITGTKTQYATSILKIINKKRR